MTHSTTGAETTRFGLCFKQHASYHEDLAAGGARTQVSQLELNNCLN